MSTNSSFLRLLELEYSYGTTANNGNVLSQTITVPGVPHPFVQAYTYDSLNRITNAEETYYTSTQTWEQTFTYDRYGNRNFDEANTTTLEKNCGTSPTFTVCTADVPKVNPAVTASTNKFTTGYNYDSSGNITEDANEWTYVYDAENKQIEVLNDDDVSVGQYWYDGDGKRIKKYVPDTGETTVFVYDAAGKQIAEYSTIVQTEEDAKVTYTTNDHLGSPRINTDYIGAVVARHDYHPFGEEIATAQRTTGVGYTDDTIRKKFTGYERDGETGLDFAQARMYAGSLGRFSTPDNFANDTMVEFPQSWNLYSYVRNRPLISTDATGKKAKTEITKDKKNKTGTIKITATFAIYAAEGQEITHEQLEEQAALLKSQIEGTYSKPKTGKDGITYTMSADITVKIVSNEREAIEKKFDNIVQVGSDQLYADGDTALAAAYRLSGESFDRMRISIPDKENDLFIKTKSVYAHEFTHLLGSSVHLTSRDVSGLGGNRMALTDRDFNHLFGTQIQKSQPESTRRAPLVSKNEVKWISRRGF